MINDHDNDRRESEMDGAKPDNPQDVENIDSNEDINSADDIKDDDIPDEYIPYEDADEDEDLAEGKEHPLAFHGQEIVEVSLEKEVRKSFLEYSMSVIISRALPDVRDGPAGAPPHPLRDGRTTSISEPFPQVGDDCRKRSRRYHPHGDTAVYDSMARMGSRSASAIRLSKDTETSETSTATSKPPIVTPKRG